MKHRTTLTGWLILALAAFAAANGFQLHPPAEQRLDNGLTVLIHRDDSLPVVHVSCLLVGAGTAFEPADRGGLAELTGRLLLRGTAGLNADALAEELDFLGAALEVETDAEHIRLSGRCLAEHLPRLLEILAGSVIAPQLAEEEFIKERNRQLEQVRAIKDNPGEVIALYGRRAYFGEHPLGRSVMGTEASLPIIGHTDVRQFYRRHVRPDRCILAVVGHFNPEELATRLQATLGAWPKPDEEAPGLALPPVPPAEPVRLLVNMPEATQANFMMVGRGLPLGDPGEPAAEVLNTIFGGRFTSWLNTELRIKRGLTYGAHSDFESWRGAGMFELNSYTRSEAIGDMLDITRDLLHKARRQGFAADEVASARTYILGQFPPRFEGGAAKADAYVRLAAGGLGFDHYARFLDAVGTVSPDAANAAAKQYLPSDAYVLVVLGKAEAIRKQLEKFGNFHVIDVSAPGFN
ncbi:MAG TPA: pitrilysin family protein [Acidobacteriota bacterium]|nr:pitrilysin family protein [Acidobacteriota bacterium]HQF87518.1 pitrilysin family protein [Acidobacteriota bacterium]HQG92710.1 pitrilysin family protein [Acidobacteriota bacterium]HQK87957.1 pitrilysin family protein [Acidobacteriota bacterium]